MAWRKKKVALPDSLDCMVRLAACLLWAAWLLAGPGCYRLLAAKKVAPAAD